MSFFLEEHRRLLADGGRLDAFRGAISELIKPGDVVMDLGCGTGILGMMACEAGASRVYAVDSGPIIEVAKEIARANGFVDRMIFIQGFSTRVELPERVDLFVGDQTGQFGWEAGILEYFPDACDRFLKPNGKMIPSRLDLFVAPLQCPDIWDNRVLFWSDFPFGFDLSAVRPLSASSAYSCYLRPEHLLSQVAQIASFILSARYVEPLIFKTELIVNSAGLLHGIGGWFSATLSPKVTISNSPLIESPIKRPQAFYPIDPPSRVRPGHRIKVELAIDPSSWSATSKIEVAN